MSGTRGRSSHYPRELSAHEGDAKRPARLELARARPRALGQLAVLYRELAPRASSGPRSSQLQTCTWVTQADPGGLSAQTD
jgi:hypothetical protein